MFTRRTMLAAGALAGIWPSIVFEGQEGFSLLEVLVDHILPGARDAGVATFVNRALGGYDAEKMPIARRGLADLGASGFVRLTHAAQIAALKAIEKSEFFEAVRTLTVLGMFSDPEYGGNQDGAGWKLIGMDHAGAFQPPFGYYDKLK